MRTVTSAFARCSPPIWSSTSPERWATPRSTARIGSSTPGLGEQAVAHVLGDLDLVHPEQLAVQLEVVLAVVRRGPVGQLDRRARRVAQVRREALDVLHPEHLTRQLEERAAVTQLRILARQVCGVLDLRRRHTGRLKDGGGVG